MPGYSQLKKLSETVLKLGNEIKLRAERGEKAIPVLIPDTIEDIDDSQDFVLGMPEKPKPPEPEPEVEEASAADSGEEQASSDVSVDDLLSGLAAGGDAPDLSAFGGSGDDAKKSKVKGAKSKKEIVPPKEKEPEPPPKPKGISGSGYSGFGFDDDGNLEESGKSEPKPDIAALMAGGGKKSDAPSAGATGIPELDAILNPPKPASTGGATGIPELDAILNPKKEEPPVPPPEPVQEAEPLAELDSEPLPSAPEPESVKAQEIDFGDLDEIAVEDYAPSKKEDSASGVDAAALFGDNVEDFEMPEGMDPKKQKPKPVFKPLPVEDDIAILKPDIFTDNPVTKENPPYYVTAPYGKLPEQPAAKAERKETPKKDAPTEDFSSLDGIEVEDFSPAEEALAGNDGAIRECGVHNKNVFTQK